MDLGGCLSKKMPVEKDKAVKIGIDARLNQLGHGEQGDVEVQIM